MSMYYSMYGVRTTSSQETFLLTELQVWKFFITFTDVLGLCPVTLDEFVQSLHDYVSPFFLWTSVCFLFLFLLLVE